MESKEVYAMLGGYPAWDATSPELRTAFIFAMARCQYGHDEMEGAFDWFRLGWLAYPT